MEAQWQPIKDCLMTPGSQILVKLRFAGSGRDAGYWHGKSVHQIGTWDAEGALWSGNRKIPLQLVEGYIFIPD